MLSKKDISDIYGPVHDWLGFDLSAEQIRDLAERHPEWEEDFHDMGIDIKAAADKAGYKHNLQD